MADEFLVVALDWNRTDLTALLQCRRRLVFDVAHERLDRGQAQVTRGGAVAALALDVSKEVQDHCRVELLDRELRGFGAPAPRGEAEQELKSNGIGFAAVRAVASLTAHVAAQEPSDHPAPEGHWASPPPSVSPPPPRPLITPT